MSEANQPSMPALASHVSSIVEAYTRRHKVPVTEIPDLIMIIGKALKTIHDPPAPKHAPIIAVKKSVRPESIACLICGTTVKLLKRHLKNRHKLTPAEYFDLFGLPLDYPLVSPSYSSKRSQMALDSGLGKKGSHKPGPRRRR